MRYHIISSTQDPSVWCVGDGDGDGDDGLFSLASPSPSPSPSPGPECWVGKGRRENVNPYHNHKKPEDPSSPSKRDLVDRTGYIPIAPSSSSKTPPCRRREI